MIRFIRTRAPTLLLLLLTALVFWPGLSGDFLLDDYPNIVSNEKIQLDRFSWDSLVAAASAYEGKGGMYRPLATMWFAIDQHLGSGDPWIFKLNGLLVHLVNALLVLMLLRQLFSLPRAKLASTPGPWLCASLALIWAIHPLQVSTVLYVVQRMEMLSLTFVLLGLLAYIKGRIQQQAGLSSWHYFLACIPLCVLALGSKETAVLFPAFALALELTVLGFSAQSPRAEKAWRWFYVVGVACALAIFLFWAVPRYTNADAYAIRDFSPWERVLTQCRVLPIYLGQILLPLPNSMSFYYDDFLVSRSLTDPITTVLGGVLMLTLFASAIVLRRQRPLYALGVVWFFTAHALTSNIVAFELVFEHRNYFALLGIVIAVFDVAAHFAKKSKILSSGALVPIALCGLALLALLRTSTWGDPFHLALDLVAKNPRSVRAGSDLATLYYGASHGDPDSAYFKLGLKEFERVAALPGASPIPEHGLIVMLATGEQTVDDRLWTRLIEKLKTRPIGSQELMSITGLLRLAESGRSIDHYKLSQAYEVLLSKSTQPASFYVRCARHALKSLGDETLAKRLILAVASRAPKEPEVLDEVRFMLVEGQYLSLAEAFESKIRETYLNAHAD